MLVADPGPEKDSSPREVYCAAASRDQAGIVYNAAAQMVNCSPQLSKLLRTIDSAKRILARQGIYGFSDRRIFRALAAVSNTAEGINSSGLVVDELHAHTNRRLFDTLMGSSASRSQPLKVIITTAGSDLDHICYKQHEYVDKLDAGVIEDDSFYGLIYAAGKDDDWTSEATWRKANPGYGLTINTTEFKSLFTKAKNSPTEERRFRRFHLNQWVADMETPWLSDVQWQSCRADRKHGDLAKWLEGKECWAGLDLSRSGDLTALVLMFEVDDLAYCLSYFWLPEEGIAERGERDGVPYDVWAEQGYLNLVPGECITHDAIFEVVEQLARRYKLRQLAADPYFAMGLDQRLMEFGLDYYEFKPSIPFWTPATKAFEEAVLGKRLRHGDHPILNWMARNVVLEEKDGQYIKPSKRKSTKRIDGIAAAVMAYGGLTFSSGSDIDWDDAEILVF
jgi:phage terminase large subunit-like protein